MRGQRENRFFCLCSWLGKRGLILQPELEVYKSEAYRQDYLTVFNKHTHTHTHAASLISSILGWFALLTCQALLFD